MSKYKEVSPQLSSQPLILFDFDGVLCDSLLLFIQIFNSLSTRYKYNKIAEQNIEQYRNIQLNEFLELAGIKNKIKLYLIIARIKKNILQKIPELSSFQEIDNLLIHLHKNNINTGILTSNAKYNVSKFLQHNSLEYFNFIISTNGLFNKSHYIKKIQKYSCSKLKNIYYVGDETRDIQASNKANINSIAVTWGFNSKKLLLKENPDFVVDTPQELKTLISELFN